MKSSEKFHFLNSTASVIEENKDAQSISYALNCTNGQGYLSIHQVFPGIELFLADFNATSCTFDHDPYGNTMQINYCQKGRVGWPLNSGACMYLGAGDLSIHMMDNCISSTMSFPVNHYQGIGIAIDLDQVSHNPPEIFRDTNIHIHTFKKKFCENNRYLVMPARNKIEHIFSGLYALPKGIQRPYFKLKVQELLLFLWIIDVDIEKQREQYLSPHVDIIKRIHTQLISNLLERPTIEELSKQYLIDTTTLKSTFKGVYGQPIATYMKEYRLRQAAILLRQYNHSIGAIANKVGYENQSKFSIAFKKMMHVSPTAYRVQYARKNISTDSAHEHIVES